MMEVSQGIKDKTVCWVKGAMALARLGPQQSVSIERALTLVDWFVGRRL